MEALRRPKRASPAVTSSNQSFKGTDLRRGGGECGRWRRKFEHGLCGLLGGNFGCGLRAQKQIANNHSIRRCPIQALFQGKFP